MKSIGLLLVILILALAFYYGGKSIADTFWMGWCSLLLFSITTRLVEKAVKE